MSSTRYASAADIPRLVKLAQAEHGRSLWKHLPFDAEFAASSFSSFITGFGKTVIVGDESYLMGTLQNLGFSRKLIALEYAWYAEDGQGLQLLTQFAQWARQMGAVAVVANNFTGDPRLGSVLNSRYGFHPMGDTFVLHLEN